MKNREKNRSSTKFITSTLMMIIALVLSYSVFIIFTPTSSSTNGGALSIVKLERQKGRTVKRVKSSKNDANKVFVKSSNKSTELENQSKSANHEMNNEVAVKSDQQKRVSSDLIKEQIIKAYELVDAENYQEAQIILEQVLSDDPTNKDALVELGYIYLFDYEDSLKAQEIIGKAVTYHPTDPMIMSEYVNMCKDNGDSQSCIDNIQNSLAKDADNPVAYRGLGDLNLSQGNYDAAIEHFSSAAEHSESPNDFLLLSRAYSKSGDAVQAIEQNKIALRKLEEQKDSDTGEYTVNSRMFKQKKLDILYDRFTIAKKHGYTEDMEASRQAVEEFIHGS